jgi:hypothetical protein
MHKSLAIVLLFESVGLSSIGAPVSLPPARPLPQYAENALTPEHRRTLENSLPHTLAAAQKELATRRQELPAMFAGSADTFQWKRIVKRLEMAERLCHFIARNINRKDITGLCRAEVAMDELAAFNSYFAQEAAAWKKYPTAPGVTPIRLNLKEFGAKGDGRTDDAAAFSNAFARIRSLAGRPCILEIPSGSYLLVGTGGFHEPHLIAAGLTNCILSGASPETTSLIYGRYDGDGIRFPKAANVTLRNVQVYWKESPFVQGTVEAVNAAEGWIVIRHHPGTLAPDDPRFSRIGYPNSCVQFDAGGKPIRRPVLWYDYRSKDLGEGRYRLWFSPEFESTRTMPVSPGAVFVFPDRDNRIEALRCPESTFFTFENVWVRNSRSGSFTPGNCFQPSLVRCRIFPRDRGLMLSTNADGFFCPAGSSLFECDFTNMNDDGCNSHNKGAILLAEADAGAGLVHEPFWGGAKNDYLTQIVCSMDGRFLANLRVKSVKLVSSGSRTLQTTLFTDSPPPGIRAYTTLGIPEYTALERRKICLGVQKVEKFPDQIYAPRSQGVGFVCSGNRFTNLRGVGVQVQCSSSLIENNVIDEVYRGIELSGLLHYQEGPPPYNVVLRGNTIRHVNMGIKSSFMTINLPPAATAPIAEVLVENNRVENISQAALLLSNVSAATIRGNHFSQCAKFQLNICEDISLSGNLLNDRPFSAKDVGIKNSARIHIGD